MKRSALIIVANGQPFIKYQLNHLYSVVDEIIIIEGADKTFEQVIGSKRSTDGTIEEIKSFNDHANKIKLIHVNVNKNEMVRVGVSNLTGDNIYHVDVDEFLSHSAINSAFTILETGEAELIKCPMHIYYKWQDVKVIGNKTKSRPEGEWQHYPRFYKNRFKEGLIPSHIPNTGYLTPNNQFIENFKIKKLDIEHIGWHYHSLYKFQLVDKFKYYSIRGDCTNEQVKVRMEEYESATREGIGKTIITSIDNTILTLDERPPLFELPKTYR